MALVALASSGVFAQPPTPTAVAPPATKRLLDQLGSAHYADREAATNKLIEDDLARPFLERLASSADAEVAARARRVITRQDQAHFKRYMRYGRDGQLERMVEGVCSSAGPVDNEEFWQEVRSVVVDLWGKVERGGERRVVPNDFIRNLKRSNASAPHRAPVVPLFRRLDAPWTGNMQHGGFLSPGYPIRADHLTNSTVLSSGPIVLQLKSSCDLVLTTEDVESGEDDPEFRIASMFVISAGRVKLYRQVSDSVIVARSGIDATGCRISNGYLATSGRINGTYTRADGPRSESESAAKNPLGIIHWFETSTVGFEAAATGAGIKVLSVIPDSEAGKAGLKSGDIVTAVDGRPAEKAIDGFRKQLRRGSVQDRCYLSVRRDGKSETLMLDFRADNRK